MTNKWSDRLRADERGGVYVEFLLAFFPMLLMFGALLQLSLLAVGGLLVEHAAVLAVRAAVVVVPDDPRFYDGAGVGSPTGRRLDDIRAAARTPLYAFERDPNPEVTFLSSRFAENELVRVRVTYDYPCRLPLGGALVCAGNGRFALHGEAAMPNQGAGYAY